MERGRKIPRSLADELQSRPGSGPSDRRQGAVAGLLAFRLLITRFPFKPGGLEVAPGSVYDNDVSRSTIEIVSRLENGEPIPQDAGGASEYMKIPAISNDGSHILMSTEASGGRVNLYMRVNDAITFEITKGSGVELLGMNSDGTKVAFISPYALTPEDTDSSTDIYMWEQSTDEVKLLSIGAGEGESDNCFANWTEKCNVQLLHTERPEVDERMSASGDVYFMSPEQLDPNNPGVRNQKNIYHMWNGHVQYVTTLEPGTPPCARRSRATASTPHS